MRDLDAYVGSAQALAAMAHDLGEREVDPVTAVDELISAAGQSLLVVRRAHRHLEHQLACDWPAEQASIRAFFYLSAARIRMERATPM